MAIFDISRRLRLSAAMPNNKPYRNSTTLGFTIQPFTPTYGSIVHAKS